MNILNKLLLRCVLLPAPAYKKMGVNISQLRLILTTKLIMDDRRPNTFHQTARKKSEKAVSLSTIGTMIFSALLGLLFLFSFAITNEPVTQLTFYFSFYIFMLASTLISDFTSVLIDVRDNFIILPKPVTDKTFVLARLLHIVIHVTKIILPMGLPGIVYMYIQSGIRGSAVLLLMILFATIFTIFLINTIYIFILKITSPQKFQGIISYVQIFMAVFVYASYQLLPRLADQMGLTGFDITSKNWAWVLPSYWFALGSQFLYTFQLQSHLIIGISLSLLVPPFTLWIVIKYFAPSFNQKLALISSGSEETNAAKPSEIKYSFWQRLGRRISATFTKKGEERMSFMLAWNLMSRSKDFKMKVYPSIGYLLVYLVITLLNKKISLTDLQNEQGGSRIIIISALYISSLLLVIAITQLQFSDKFKAAWIFFTTPITKPGLLLAGALKAAIFKFFVPLALIISVTGIILIGPQLLPNIFLGLSNVLFGCTIIASATQRNLPFSQSQTTTQKSGAFLRGLLSAILPLSFGLVHYMVYNLKWVVVIGLAMSLLANWLIFGFIKNKSWTEILSSYQD